MGLGHNCPNCGENTFHAKGRIRECSACNAVGWVDGDPGSPGSGSGVTCQHCEARTLRDMFTVGKKTVKYCYSCYSLVAV